MSVRMSSQVVHFFDKTPPSGVKKCILSFPCRPQNYLFLGTNIQMGMLSGTSEMYYRATPSQLVVSHNLSVYS